MDPYQTGLSTSHFYLTRREVRGSLVAIMRGRLEQRGLLLIPQPSRAVRQGDVHEFISSAEPGIGPKSTVNSVSYVGFVEFSAAGVICVGDAVKVRGLTIGTIAGFDDTHMPNHMNIVIAQDRLQSGAELGLKLEEPVSVGAA
jgi:hypothetical protein